MDEYEVLTRRTLDRDRVNLLTGILHLAEIAGEGEDAEILPMLLQFFAHWAARQ